MGVHLVPENEPIGRSCEPTIIITTDDDDDNNNNNNSNNNNVCGF